MSGKRTRFSAGVPSTVLCLDNRHNSNSTTPVCQKILHKKFQNMSHNETLSEKRENISTPTPWEIGHQLGDGFSITHEIAPNCGRLVCIATAHNTCAWSGHMSDDIAKANRDLIIKAVNSHEALCTAAELLADVREAFLDAIDRGDSDGSVTEIMRGFLAGDVIADALEAVEAQIKI